MKYTQRFYKVLILVFCTLLLIPIFGAWPRTQALTEVRDQYYNGVDTGSDDMEAMESFPMTQSFIPTLDNITKIRWEFTGSGTNDNWQISIMDVPGNRLKNIRGDLKSGWVDFVLDSPFSVTLGTTYKIEIMQCGPTNLESVYTIPGGYSQGEANTGMPAPNKDYHFETYGYADSTSSEDSNGDDDSQQNSLPDIGMMLGDSLKPPSNLGVKADNSGKCAVLGWDAISNVNEMIGYSIFRSTKKDKDYKEITSVSGNTEEYKDCDVELGKKYYYKIRTRDGASESEDSDTVSITLEETINTWIYWIIAGVILLILIIVYLIIAKKKQLWPFKIKTAKDSEIQK